MKIRQGKTRTRWTALLGALLTIFLVIGVSAKLRGKQPIEGPIVDDEGGKPRETSISIDSPEVQKFFGVSKEEVLARCFKIFGSEPLQWLEVAPGDKILAFKTPLPAHEHYWQQLGIDPAFTEADIISIPDVVCSMDRKKLFFPVANYLHFGASPSAYRPRLGATAWAPRLVSPVSGEPSIHRFALRDGEKRWMNSGSGNEGGGQKRYVYYLAVPPPFASKILAKGGVPFSQDNIKAPFWSQPVKHNVPVFITFTLQEAAALLSAGYAGVTAYRCAGVRFRKFSGSELKAHLDADIKFLAHPGANVVIVISDTSTDSWVGMHKSLIYYAASAFAEAGANVRIMTLMDNVGGVDQFLRIEGVNAFDAVLKAAPNFETWKAKLTDILSPDQVLAKTSCQ